MILYINYLLEVDTESSFEVDNVRNLDTGRLVDSLAVVDEGADNWDFEVLEDSRSLDEAVVVPVKAHLVEVEQEHL